MVLTEAMAAGLPVVALDAPGAREVVKDQHNGRLLLDVTAATFSAALHWLTELSPEQVRGLETNALDTAAAFSMPRSADKALPVTHPSNENERCCQNRRKRLG